MRPNDFHGRRAYASDGSDQGLVSRASVVIAWIKLQLGRLSHDVSTVVLSRPSRRMGDGFSLLGLDQRPAQLRELNTNVFPMDRGRPVTPKPSKQVKARE